MEIKFDMRGFLFSYEKITLTLEEFEENFVNKFRDSATRQRLFGNYTKYLEDFASKLTPNFTQWINGSFVTKKLNPRDIDMVTLLDYKMDMANEKVIAERFVNRQAIKIYGVDAYTLTVFPEGHRQAVQTKSDMLYWNDWFGRSWSTKTDKRFPKGYVEITFNNNQKH